jgi:tripeptide aminopeptidase
VTVRGPGGHSYSAFGLVNPVLALGRAIARIAEFAVPQDPKTTFNVGRIGGGTSVNSIAFEAWMEIDMRSADAMRLRTLDAQLHRALDAALADEHARWSNGGKLTMDRQLVGDRPAGTVSESAPIAQSAVGATRALDMPVSLVEGSTDANYPMSLGVPAITIDGGGSGEHAHSLEERFDTTNS